MDAPFVNLTVRSLMQLQLNILILFKNYRTPMFSCPNDNPHATFHEVHPYVLTYEKIKSFLRDVPKVYTN